MAGDAGVAMRICPLSCTLAVDFFHVPLASLSAGALTQVPRGRVGAAVAGASTRAPRYLAPDATQVGPVLRQALLCTHPARKRKMWHAALCLDVARKVPFCTIFAWPSAPLGGAAEPFMHGGGPPRLPGGAVKRAAFPFDRRSPSVLVVSYTFVHCAGVSSLREGRPLPRSVRREAEEGLKRSALLGFCGH